MFTLMRRRSGIVCNRKWHGCSRCISSCRVQKFTDKGHGDIVSSWVGTGEKLPISADQISSVLGSDTIKNIADKTGMDTNAVTGQLSTLLPQVVDKLTPGGKMPEGDILSKGSDLLGGLTGKL